MTDTTKCYFCGKLNDLINLDPMPIMLVAMTPQEILSQPLQDGGLVGQHEFVQCVQCYFKHGQRVSYDSMPERGSA